MTHSETWTVTHRRIPEHPVDGMPLGRVVRHDSRSLAYPWLPRGVPLQSVLHARRVGIFDQGVPPPGTGSCTGQAEMGLLGTDPFFQTMTARGFIEKDFEPLALAVYSGAEIIDGGAGLPSEDQGSSGLSVCQAAKGQGLISGYLHAFGLAAVLDALQTGPLIVGSNWYDSQDQPDSNGLVTISPGAQIRGMHEYLVRGEDVAAKTVFCDNSWGLGYGVKGSFTMGWPTLDRLLSEQGDATISVPLSQPAPVPVPPGVSPADVALAAVAKPWAAQTRTRADLKALQQALSTWVTGRGF